MDKRDFEYRSKAAKPPQTTPGNVLGCFDSRRRTQDFAHLRMKETGKAFALRSLNLGNQEAFFCSYSANLIKQNSFSCSPEPKEHERPGITTANRSTTGKTGSF